MLPSALRLLFKVLKIVKEAYIYTNGIYHNPNIQTNKKKLLPYYIY